LLNLYNTWVVIKNNNKKRYLYGYQASDGPHYQIKSQNGKKEIFLILREEVMHLELSIHQFLRILISLFNFKIPSDGKWL
jgi:hypothetical protein